MRLALFAAAMAVSSFALVPAFAETMTFKATLSADQEVPPHPGLKGSGMVQASVDTATRDMTYHVTFEGLTGEATAAHFHGPAPSGKNAGVQIPVAGQITSGMDGSAVITEAQFKMLEGGEMYFNIHTKANPGGEIRGQLVK